MTPKTSQPYAPWLWLLLGLFTVRVVAQPVSLIVDARLLPRFESWHSGALPYPFLLLMQLIILAWLTYTAWQFTQGTVAAHRRVGILMLVLGSAYFMIMLARLILGATLLAELRWFASPLPAFFHLVLATFLLLYGHFHFRYGPKTS